MEGLVVVVVGLVVERSGLGVGESLQSNWGVGVPPEGPVGVFRPLL